MLEPVDQQYVMVGSIARSQGVDGTVLLIPEICTPELFDTIDLVRLQDARGDLVPARIESIRVQQKNNRLSFFVKFDHITDRNQAETIKNFRVYAAKTAVDHLIKQESSDSFISFEVKDNNDAIVGTVDEIIDSAAHPILVVNTEARQLLIPFVDEYIVSTDEKNAIIYCKNLDQLTDL